MDFDKLLEPYQENGRTVKGQIVWLIKNGLPHTSIDYAMSAVYKRIENGETFENGSALDQELRNVAKAHFQIEAEQQVIKRINEVEAALDADWNRLGKMGKIWAVITGKA